MHNRCWFRQTFRRGILLTNGFFELLRILRAYAMPAFFDLRAFNTVLNRWCVSCLRLKGGSRRYHIELSALSGLTEVCLRIGRRIECKFNLLDILIGFGCYSLNRRPEVIDHVIVRDNVRDVLCPTDDLNALLGSLDVPRVARFAPMRKADKSVSSRSDAII